ncbi:uncharacterized protein [Amphiura filiformis]|uniref:uncharacterized protein n=1 Tax=Amphiura filiformis TaxID=82378 RepID=UPI003B216908
MQELLELHLPVLSGYHAAMVKVWADESSRQETQLAHLCSLLFHAACDMNSVIDEMRQVMVSHGLQTNNTCTYEFDDDISDTNRAWRNCYVLSAIKNMVTDLMWIHVTYRQHYAD